MDHFFACFMIAAVVIFLSGAMLIVLTYLLFSHHKYAHDKHFSYHRLSTLGKRWWLLAVYMMVGGFLAAMLLSAQ